MINRKSHLINTNFLKNITNMKRVAFAGGR
jgi:hypothetical protein